jgi:hypothetical protein
MKGGRGRRGRRLRRGPRRLRRPGRGLRRLLRPRPRRRFAGVEKTPRVAVSCFKFVFANAGGYVRCTFNHADATQCVHPNMSNPTKIYRPTVRASWTGLFSPALWRRLSLVANPSNATPRAERMAIGPGLHSAHDTRMVLLSVEKSAKQIKYVLFADQPPDSAPPADIAKADHACGGQEGIRALLTRIVGTRAAPVARYSVHFHLNQSKWRCHAIPRSLDRTDAVVSRLSRTATIEHIGYRLDGGANGLEEISVTYYHESGFFGIDLLARGVLLAGESSFLPYADDVRDLVVANFFVEKS